ncbi:hypothetical protein [Musicola keenii]|uniref:hypothetical protein n=1 Tax=Musicola keenii TaxID=2884250 RepID=UPI001CE385A6|nr:hypothetical protein [Musicola keenii]
MWQTRAIEITSSDLWSWNTIIRVVDDARQHQFNALVLGLREKDRSPDVTVRRS